AAEETRGGEQAARESQQDERRPRRPDDQQSLWKGKRWRWRRPDRGGGNILVNENASPMAGPYGRDGRPAKGKLSGEAHPERRGGDDEQRAGEDGMPRRGSAAQRR